MSASCFPKPAANASGSTPEPLPDWTEKDEIVSEEPSYSFTVTGNRNLVAHLLFVDYLGESHGVDINIYPNPVAFKLTVETSQIIDKWEIFNASGALVYSSNDSCDKIEFKVSHLAPGTYMIRMTTDNFTLIRKFVKK